MKRLTTVFLLLSLLSFQLNAQEKDRPVLNISGSAKVTVKPDLGVLNIAVTEIKPTMSDAIKALGDKSSFYNQLLKKMGFDEKDIRTTGFSVNKHFVYRDEQYIDSGYQASQNVRLVFPYDQKTLQKIISEFSKSQKSIDFSFQFELSEALKKKVQAQVIDEAVKDANEKAMSIAKATGLKLLSIKEISYASYFRDNGMEQVESVTRFASMGYTVEAPSINFTPEDLVFRDSLLIVWFIESLK